MANHLEVADLMAENERLRALLQYYASMYCEGWCKDNPPNANFEDCDGCDGCRARLALTSRERK